MITEVDLDIQTAARGNPTTSHQSTNLFETLHLRLRTKQLCNQMLTLSMNEIIDQKNTLTNFTLKKLFFVAINIVKIVIKVSMCIADLE